MSIDALTHTRHLLQRPWVAGQIAHKTSSCVFVARVATRQQARHVAQVLARDMLALCQRYSIPSSTGAGGEHAYSPPAAAASSSHSLVQASSKDGDGAVHGRERAGRGEGGGDREEAQATTGKKKARRAPRKFGFVKASKVFAFLMSGVPRFLRLLSDTLWFFRLLSVTLSLSMKVFRVYDIRCDSKFCKSGPSARERGQQPLRIIVRSFLWEQPPPPR